MEHSIIHGGYFYSSSTMQDSMFGLVHCFITNFPNSPSQSQSRYLLQRLAIFYYQSFVLNHDNANCMFSTKFSTIIKIAESFFPVQPSEHLPQLDNFDSVLNFFTFCNLIILQNVLDPLTYIYSHQGNISDLTEDQIKTMDLYDFNAMSLHDRRRATYARGLCKHLISWLSSQYRFTSESGDVVDGSKLFYFYLGTQAAALFVYKRLAEAEGVRGVPGCTQATLRRQIEWCIERSPHCLKAFSMSIQHDFKVLGYTGPKYCVEKKPGPIEFFAFSQYKLLINLVFFLNNY